MRESLAQLACWEAIARDPAYRTPMQQMLVEDDAEAATREGIIDREEVLALLPTLPPGAHAVEFGAGLGRFTEALAARAARVSASDFVQAYVDGNRARCLELGLAHVTVERADAVTAAIPQGVGLVFFNWLLEYFTDEEAPCFLARCAAALAPGGYLFFREACDEEDAGLERRYAHWSSDYPARYRAPRWYTEALSLATRDLPGTLLRRAEVLPLWTAAYPSTPQCAWLWQRAT